MGLLAFCGAARGQYEIDWWTTDSGGGTSRGGDYELQGTIGQPDAGILRGDNFTLVGGFWGGMFALEELPLPRLSIHLTPAKTVLISWPYPSTGFELLVNSDLSTANWELATPAPVQVGDQYQVEVFAPTAHRFYCLRRACLGP